MACRNLPSFILYHVYLFTFFFPPLFSRMMCHVTRIFFIFLATYFIFQYFTPPAVSFHSFCRKFYLFFLQPDILDAHDMLRFNISGKKIVDKFISLLVKSVLKLSLLPSRTSRNSIVLT